MRNGISGHVGNIWRMMCRANCEDGFLGEACTKSYSLETLSKEVEDEMETDHLNALIESAVVRGNSLFVTNKAGRELRINFYDILALRRIDYRDRANFVIQHNGSCLYWESGDIHLDFESLLYYVDPEVQAKVDRQTIEHYRSYGKAIWRVRTAYNIPIDGIEGLEPKEVQDIESGRIQARATNLCFYSEAIGITLNEFMDKVAANVDVDTVRRAIG